MSEGGASGTHYAKEMFSPFSWVDAVLFDPLPIKVRPFDLLLLIIALTSRSRSQRVRPMRSTLLVAAATTVLWLVIGISRGGDVQSASWQVYLMLASIIAAFAIGGVYHKASHYRAIVKAIVAAGLYRGFMCLIYYVQFIKDSGVEPPPVFTSHDDSVLWVVTIMILTVHFLYSRKWTAWAGALAGVPLIVIAIQLNNRRLAWVSLVGSLVTLYFLLPPSRPMRVLKRIGMVLVPLIAIYVAVGWGRTEAIFKPVAAFSSTSESSDSSTKSRNAENLSLIYTASFRPMTGTGWGHPFVSLTNKYSVAHIGPLWRFIPHNSILGLFAFIGLVGMIGYWMMFPVAVFLHARTAQMSSHPMLRSLGIVCVAAIVICLNQIFGDMGIFSRTTMYMLALALAPALCVPIEAGAWPAANAAGPHVMPAPPADVAPGAA